MSSKYYIFMLSMTIDANCFKARTFNITVKVFDLAGASINSPREVFASTRVVRVLPVISIAISRNIDMCVIHSVRYAQSGFHDSLTHRRVHPYRTGQRRLSFVRLSW